MEKRKDYIDYFCKNVDEEELLEYVAEAEFDLIELLGLTEDQILRRYHFSDSGSDAMFRRALKRMLKDLDMIDSNMVCQNYYLNYFN